MSDQPQSEFEARHWPHIHKHPPSDRIRVFNGPYEPKINLSKLHAHEANALFRRAKEVTKSKIGDKDDVAFAELITGTFIPQMKSVFGDGIEVLVIRAAYKKFMRKS